MTIVVGTAGHIDHGKTALLRALTGIDADRLPEERRRGMTIDVGYAHLDLGGGRSIDFIDVPGHDRLVGNMLVGAGEIDAALLVIAADDGPRAQTVEHLELLDALGISGGVVAVTKIDTLEPGDRRWTEIPEAVRRLLSATSLAAAPIVLVSAETGEGLDALRAELETMAARLASAGTDASTGAGGTDATGGADVPRASPGRIRLAVDRAFTVRGRGAVVTGTLRGGSVAPGMALRILPDGPDARVREVQVHGLAVGSAGSGRTALNLAGIEAGSLRRGLVVTDDPAVAATDRLLVALRPAPGIGLGAVADVPAAGADVPAAGADVPAAGADAVAPGADVAGSLRLHLGTDQVEARLERGSRWSLDAPSGERIAVVRLARPIAAAPGDRFVLRRPSPAATVAGGRVLDAIPPRGVSRRRATPERLAALAGLGSAVPPAGSAPAHAALGGPASALPSPDAVLELHGALTVERWRAIGGTGRPPAAGLVLAPDVLAGLVDGARTAVAAYHAADPDSVGVPLLDLRRSVARDLRHRVAVPAPEALAAAAALVDGLVAAHRLARSGDRIRDPRRPEVLPPALAAAMDRLEALLASPSPPSFAAAMRAAACSVEGVRRLEMAGRLVRLGPDLAFAATTYRELEALALAMADAAPLTPAAFRDATGTSRRYVLAVLEDLDRRGLLVRTSEGHRRGTARVR